MCAELLFGSVLVHIISFECPLKKLFKKKEKKREKEAKEKKRKGLILEIFFSFTSGGVLCSPLCPGSRL